MANKKSSSKSKSAAARKAANSMSTKNIIIIAVAAILIIGLLVVLAYSPVGKAVIDKIGAPEETAPDNANNGNAPDNGNNAASGFKYVSIGSDITLETGEIVLENVVLSVHFIDVGQGDAIVVQLPDGKTMMIDGGSTSAGLNEYKAELKSYIHNAGITQIEYMIATHPDTDHYNMLTAVMDEFVVKDIYYNDCNKNQTYDKFRTRIASEVAESNGHSYAIDADGEDYVITGTGYTVNIYAPGYYTIGNGDDNFDAEESNGMSPIIILECAGKKLMFVGDATDDTEEWFMNKMGGASLDVDFLKVGHHGSNTSSSQAFLDYITPEYCVIMADMGKAYEHPHASTMNKLFNMGIVTYRTNRHGDIVLEIDEDGDMAFIVEKEVPTENNTKDRNDLMIRTEK